VALARPPDPFPTERGDDEPAPFHATEVSSGSALLDPEFLSEVSGRARSDRELFEDAPPSALELLGLHHRPHVASNGSQDLHTAPCLNNGIGSYEVDGERDAQRSAHPRSGWPPRRSGGQGDPEGGQPHDEDR